MAARTLEFVALVDGVEVPGMDWSITLPDGAAVSMGEYLMSFGANIIIDLADACNEMGI